jgi:hypothetical protein
MFAAQVSCEGCHLDLNNDGKSDISERRQSCVKCHEPGYDLILTGGYQAWMKPLIQLHLELNIRASLLIPLNQRERMFLRKIILYRY